MNYILWVILGIVILMLVIPVFAYTITKCMCDAKNKSRLEFLTKYKYLGGKDGEEKDVNER